MSVRVEWVFALVGVVLLGSTMFIPRPSEAQEAPPPRPERPAATDFKPVAPHHDLMEWHERIYNGLNLSIAREKQDEAKEHAWLLAELANINRLHKDKDDFRQWATQVRDTAAEAARLLEQKDFEQAKRLSKKINDTCTACHDVYREAEEKKEGG